MKKNWIISLTLACCVTTVAHAQKRACTISDVYRVKNASGPVVSANGILAYTLSSTNLKAQTSASDIYVADERITNDGRSYAPVWSCDGKALYYTSTQSGLPQLWRYDLESKASTQITRYELGIDGAVLSPDNHLIAFAAEVYPHLGADGKANAEARRLKRENKLQAHIADALLYRHWSEYVDGRYWHVIVYDIERQTYTDLTPGNFHAPTFSPSGPEGFAFSPDSKELCFVSNHTPNPAQNTNSDLWIVPVEGGEARNITSDNEAWDGSPQYSPDGRYIAYRKQCIPGYESDRFRLALYDRVTGEKRVLTEEFDNWVDSYQWAPDSRSIYFLGEESGYEPLFQVDVRKGKLTKVIGERAIGSFDLAGKDSFYYTYSTVGKPSAIYSMVKGHETQITHYNDALEAEVDFRPAEAMWVKGAEGDSVEVFVVKPHGFTEGKKYPLVINVHGGPQMQWMDSFRADWQVYPGAGYVVAFPNPHGSTGRGQKFCRDISGSWGGRPYEDVMKVTDMLASLDYVDADRMGAMGWSYGGYFMNWLQGNTRRFKCLASMMGLYDLRSMWGATEELWFPNFDLEGQPWNSPLYQKWSPSEKVANFATPTLIITGERDYRVPYTQSLQYFNVLQTLGIPSRLIIFDNDGHWPSSLHSLPLYYNAHLEWFHQYLGGDPAPWDSQKLVSGEQTY